MTTHPIIKGLLFACVTSSFVGVVVWAKVMKEEKEKRDANKSTNRGR